jgi:hypothetical protein
VALVTEAWHDQKLMMINENKDHLGEERARCLAGVWANIHFLGCQYSPEVTVLIRDWPKPNMLLQCGEEKSARESPPHPNALVLKNIL